MASADYSNLKVPKTTRSRGRFRLSEINKILDPLINKETVITKADYQKLAKRECEDFGFCFIEEDAHRKGVLSPKLRKNTLNVSFTESIGDINCLSASENSAALEIGVSAREITFGTRFENIRACYFEHWKYDEINMYLQKMFLHLVFQADRNEKPRQFFAIHADPDLINPYPEYNGVTHVHVGEDILSNMHIVTALTSRGLTFSDIEQSDLSFALAVKQVCRELERKKLSPLKYP